MNLLLPLSKNVPLGLEELKGYFMGHVLVPSDKTKCWVWAGVKHRGYGVFRPSGEKASRWAHRLSYIYHVGDIPDGLVIDHICENRACVNPAHLKPVTLSQNTRLWLRRRDKLTLDLPF